MNRGLNNQWSADAFKQALLRAPQSQNPNEQVFKYSIYTFNYDIRMYEARTANNLPKQVLERLLLEITTNNGFSTKIKPYLDNKWAIEVTGNWFVFWFYVILMTM